LKDIAKPPLPSQAEAEARRALAVKFEDFFLYAVPGRWLRTAIDAGLRALEAGCVLWWISGMNGHQPKHLIVRPDHRERWGLSKRGFLYGVAELERAGLVKVERKPGRPAKITLIVWGETVDGGHIVGDDQEFTLDDVLMTPEQIRECMEGQQRYWKTWPQPFLTRLLWDMSWPERICLEVIFEAYGQACDRHWKTHGFDCRCADELEEVFQDILNQWIELHGECPHDWQGNIGMGTMNQSLKLQAHIDDLAWYLSDMRQYITLVDE
jgi:hypothetical protein